MTDDSSDGRDRTEGEAKERPDASEEEVTDGEQSSGDRTQPDDAAVDGPDTADGGEDGPAAGNADDAEE